ncbi:hypothetical protein A3842_07875 [Paenibacillus sp. P3E]|uniref:phosphotransferase enzyme family protein n=1 Tax=Paenibacillus sp. P3E TaxID=1349435 RepID=UPI000940396E|nr:phosphotransferase [Paenibacillus sp. P3E]OKP84768.1 hypothetical protein A3842_07875 [Paenibacillus sp. P3E]
MKHFPVTYSTPSAPALLKLAAEVYNMDDLTECVLIKRGFNDTYLLAGNDRKYILRVYRYNKRTVLEISEEVQLLLELSKRGVSVSSPIPLKNDTLIGNIACPEGSRQFVLFTYVDGHPLNLKDDAQVHAFGKAVAQLHECSSNFNIEPIRKNLSLEQLINTSILSMKPFLNTQSEEWRFLSNTAERVIDHIKKIDNLDFGMCHGDLHPGNVHIKENYQFFDFDFCGFGWSAYDLATIKYELLTNRVILRPADQEKKWDIFLDGYDNIRKLKKNDIRAVPWFIVVRHLWYMGAHNDNLKDHGIVDMNETSIDHFLNILRYISDGL